MLNKKTIFAGIALSAAFLWKCGSDNSLGTVDQVLPDTVYTTRTIRETVYADTLFVMDTIFVSRDTSGMLFFGLVCDLSAYTTMFEPYDSAYTMLTVYGDPVRTDVSATINSVPLLHSAKQRADFAWGLVIDNPYNYPYLSSAFFDTTTALAASYAMQIVVPIYPSDTISPVLYDTISDTVTMPAILDSASVSDTTGARPRITDSTSVIGQYFLIDNTSDITVSWPSTGDLYLVSVMKTVLDTALGVYLLPETIDTFLVANSLTIPASFAWIDSAPNQYDVLEIDIVPMGGPVPSTWDTLPSFDSHGLFLSLRAEYYAYELLVPTFPDTGRIWPTGLSKSPRARKSGNALDIVKKAMQKRAIAVRN